MHPNKIILAEAIAFVILYILVYTLAPKFNQTSGGDAAGNGMGRGLLMLSIVAVFFFIAIALTVTNYFILKGVTHPGIKFLAFIPILSSVAHIAYFIFFG